MARRGTTAKINLDELERICALQPTDVELAAFFHVSVRTIERRRRDRKFAEIMERGKAMGKLSLRRLQLRHAERGNSALLIWLGKQHLGQAEHVEHRVDVPKVLRAIIMPKIWEVPPEVMNPPPRPPLPPPESDADRRRRQLEQDYLAIRRAEWRKE